MFKLLDKQKFRHYPFFVLKTRISQQIFNKTLAATLVFWLSGLVFLFCCGTPNTSPAAAEKDSCPLAKASHCNKKASGDDTVSQFVSLEIEGRAFNCCVLPNIFDKARKIETNQQIAKLAPPPLNISRTESSVVEIKSVNPINYRPPVLNRGGTYLKNRVFRI